MGVVNMQRTSNARSVRCCSVAAGNRLRSSRKYACAAKKSRGEEEQRCFGETSSASRRRSVNAHASYGPMPTTMRINHQQHEQIVHRRVAAVRAASAVKSTCSALGARRSARASTATRGPRGRRRGAVVVFAGKDYYELLGVSRRADKAELKKAYRQLARKYHPDVNKEPGAEDTFMEISNAYEVLTDDQKRSIYDQYGEAGLKSMGGMGAGPGMGDFSNPFDLFESFFGANPFGAAGGGGPRGQQVYQVRT